MHLAIDLSESEHQPTGVGTFASSLVDCWQPQVQAGELELTVCVRDERSVPARWSASGVRTCAAGRADAHPILWQQTTLRRQLRRLRPDCFFGPAYSLPHATGVPSAVALHDLSFERYPAAWGLKERWRRRLLARSAARRAEVVITISRFSAREIEVLYRVPGEKIHVVPLGLRTDLAAADETTQTALRQRLGLSSELPIILHVGTLLERRHVPGLAQAVGSLQQQAQLVVVGHNRSRPALQLEEIARKSGLGDRLVHVPYLASGDLATIYSLSDLYVSLSDYEGFGLPVLEAIACNTPALVLDVGASRELWGAHAHLVKSISEEDVPNAIDQVLAEPSLGLRGRDALLERYTWDQCARQVLSALRGIRR